MRKFNLDIYRYYGNYRERIRDRIIRPNGLKWLRIYRRYNETSSFLIKMICKLKYTVLKKRTFIQIPLQTKIGKGLYIGHDGPIVINPLVVIGNNCNISNGVTIGQENRGQRVGTPTIGNDVWIGSNAVVVGKVNIGDDVLIAPNSFVNFNVPNHSVVIGNPAKIIHRSNATKGYINRKV